MTASDPAQETVPDPRAPGGQGFGTTRRIAVNAVTRSVGEVVAKLSSLLFFLAIARELGEQQFGDFMFAVSLSTVLLIAAGFGTTELIARDVARDRGRLDEIFWDVVALKATMLIGMLGVMAGIVVLQGYPLETAAAILIVGVGVGIEYQRNSWFAVLQAYEQQRYVAASLVVARVFTAAVGIAVLLEGGGLLPAAVVYAVGSLLGLVSVNLWMRSKVVRPRGDVDRSRWSALLRLSLPLGLASSALVGLRALDGVLLSFLGGSDNTEVGQYGAAYRLIESTLFLSWAFGAAVLPWFARHTGSGAGVTLARGYQMALKAVISILLPITLVYLLFAEPLIETLYGQAYSDSVTPQRFLAPVVMLIGINSLMYTVFIGRDRAREILVPVGIAAALNVGLNLFLIPRYGADGAAFTATVSGLLLAAQTLTRATRLLGSISPLQVVVAPLFAGAAMAAATVLLSGVPWVPAAILATGVYGGVFLLVERFLFPGDFAYYSGMLRRTASPASA